MSMIHRTRKVVRPTHLNSNGTLFGGQALMWIDEEAAIFARCKLDNKKIVTVKMSSIMFENPGNLGDILSIGCVLVKAGKTSITIECEIRNKSTGNRIVHVDQIVFVSVDEHGNPTPHGLVIDSTSLL